MCTVEYISSLSYASAARILQPRQINREASEITTRTYVKGKRLAKERIFLGAQAWYRNNERLSSLLLV